MIKKSTKAVMALFVAVILIVAVALSLGQLFDKNEESITAITREGVVTEIQKLNRLNSVAFSVDTVISSEKQGSWYKLWQDSQKGLFVAHGRVLAGVDLSKLSTESVAVSYEKDAQDNEVTHIHIELPATEVFEVYLDNIQVYDWKTGLFGLVDNDPEILNQAQIQGKLEVLKKACDSGVLEMAADNAKEQVAGLFALTQAKVTVDGAKLGECRLL
ncbi:MAG: DUF4230 domain-containing protein [Moraxella sp.]|nr:DUF4230 domain-containing protein [Moraxella sp.]